MINHEYLMPPLLEGEVLPDFTLANDGRNSIKELYEAYDALERAGWEKHLISSQGACLPTDQETTIPIYAFESSGSDPEDDLDCVLIAGIHGREPVGPNTIVQYIEKLIEIGKTKRVLVLPLCNPYGYFNNLRFGTQGESVADSDHLLGYADAPRCHEAEEITSFLMARKISKKTRGLNLHEDPAWEDRISYVDSEGTYIYVTGERADQHPITLKILMALQENDVPLIMEGKDRDEIPIRNGMIFGKKDGSVDQLLAERCGATPVITTEYLLKTPTNPPLEERVKVYLKVLDVFFGKDN